MRATLIRRYELSDGEHSFAWGNMQILSSGNVFGGWGDEAYITEHTADGELAFERSFTGDRFVNYRAYKFNFTSTPADWPAAKAFASTNRRGEFTTIVYVSWDGATEVHRWRVRSVRDEDDPGTVIAIAGKTGFETSLVCPGYHSLVLVEALDVHGEVLSSSAVINAELPLGWHDIASEAVDESRSELQLRRLAMSFSFGMVVMFFLLRRRPGRLKRLLGPW